MGRCHVAPHVPKSERESKQQLGLPEHRHRVVVESLPRFGFAGKSNNRIPSKDCSESYRADVAVAQIGDKQLPDLSRIMLGVGALGS